MSDRVTEVKECCRRSAGASVVGMARGLTAERGRPHSCDHARIAIDEDEPETRASRGEGVRAGGGGLSRAEGPVRLVD